jgi:hypothetical protein
VVLATQNPVDLDYKGLANIGTWFVGKLQTDQDRQRLRDGLLDAGMEAAALERLLAATRKRVFLLHDVHRPRPCLLHSRWAMSYLRGPLTRDEISRLMKGRQPAASAAGTAAAPAPGRTAAAASAGPPVLPAPLRHAFLSRHGGDLATPYLLVKYAVRYKGAGETVETRAWPLQGRSMAEDLEADPLPVPESALAADPPAGLRYGELPSYVASARGIEKALKDRLPDKLATTLWLDPASKAVSRPGETPEAFAARVAQESAGPRQAKVREKLDKKRRDLAAAEQDLSGRKREKWAAWGNAVLSNIGLITGRKRTISNVPTAMSKQRMEDTAESRVEALRAEVAALEAEAASGAGVDPGRFEQQQVVPARGGLDLLRYDVLWVY